jgi:hypothetical protein
MRMRSRALTAFTCTHAHVLTLNALTLTDSIHMRSCACTHAERGALAFSVGAILQGPTPSVSAGAGKMDGRNIDDDILPELVADTHESVDKDESFSKRARIFGTHACVYISA